MSETRINKADVLDLVEALGYNPNEVYYMHISAGEKVFVDFIHRAARDADWDESVKWETAQPHAVRFLSETLGLDPELFQSVSLYLDEGDIEVRAQTVPFLAT